ncbi:hypothetical protein [Rhodanobacter lindaniclasticus]|uniref:Uncharacterized protein n=1 Tax=Rhodanobacter lindaniclasticus TaxID=75310 RepID=A0A4S3KLC1_9GAMM|nr:hypothetical protein [Rhodanobacter lindaniclasticus]THD09647.1 hypothetical protein B1991_01800 [Rhodanobacter lindaniclasticus]
MKRPTVTTALWQAAALASLLLLAACGKHDESAPAPPPAGSVAPAASVMPTPAPAHTAAAAPAGSSAIAPATTVATAAAIAPAPLAFSKLTVGDAIDKSHQVTHAADHFDADAHTLYASVATVGSSTDATIDATWRYLEGRGQLVSKISQSIATDGPAITTFQVHNPDLWPEGKYTVDITVDGKPAASQDFRIGKS